MSTTYPARPGDTLFKIADENCVEVGELFIANPYLIQENGQIRTRPYLGELLYLPEKSAFSKDANLKTGETNCTKKELPKKPKRKPSKDLLDIFILVAGTTDPFNTNNIHARSYRNPDLKEGVDDEEWYWRINPKLSQAFKDMKRNYHNLHIFPYHGWSGDNNVANRKVAGAFLADRLIGDNGQDSYYEGFLDREVYLHFIGHSHGGNVINEITERLANSTKFPARWKIKSITYLSTPFFKKLHQVNTKHFAPDATVINVYNRYDITQRVIADFSIHQLLAVLNSLDIGKLKTGLEKIMQFEIGLGVNDIEVVDADDKWYKVDIEVRLTQQAGHGFYGRCLTLLGDIQALIKTAMDLISELAQEIEYPVSTYLDGQANARRQPITSALAEQINKRLERILQGLNPTISAFEARRATNVYPVAGFVDDLHVVAFLNPLLEFLELNTDTLDSELTQIFYKVLSQQFDVFDNTVVTPAKQLESGFSGTLDDVEVNKEDAFENQYRADDPGKLRLQLFRQFMLRMEALERDYEAKPSQATLVDMILTLAAQESLVGTWITWLNRINVGGRALQRRLDENNDLNPILADILEVTEAWYQALFSRRVAHNLNNQQIVIQSPSDDTGFITRFAEVSHSVSRMDLYPEVKTLLEQQIVTPALR